LCNLHTTQNWRDRRASTVYFARAEVWQNGENIINKVQHLFDVAEFGNFINQGDLTAIKLHFGE
jgi:hypothetical protein